MTAAVFQLEREAHSPHGLSAMSAELRAITATNNRALLAEWRPWFFAMPPTEEPDEWAEANFVFDEEEIKGPCDFTGRNYLRKPIRDNNDPAVQEQTIIMGRGNGKTITYTIGICWKIKHKPTRGLMLLPATLGEGGSRNYISTRLEKDILATPDLAKHLPQGQLRYAINKQHVTMNGAHFGFVGSNSPGQSVGNRLGDVRLDEIEKFKKKIGNEAGTAKLVKDSTEGVKEFQIYNTSTPSVASGLSWVLLLKTDFQLYFLPCPECNGGEHGETEEERVIEALAKKFKGWFVYAWNMEYSAGLPLKITIPGPHYDLEIPRAYIKWPAACKSKQGDWDKEMVKRTSYMACPHCRAKIRDIAYDAANPPTATSRIILAPQTKNWMDENGCWIATQPGEPRHRGYQAASLYAPVINEASTWGNRANKFLSAYEEDSIAINNFINAFLGLPEMGQGHGRNTIELSGAAISQPDWIPLLTADFHKNHPYIWFVVRRWCPFKLLPMFAITDGRPEFVPYLDLPGNEIQREMCAQLLDISDPSLVTRHSSPVWHVIAELMRFKSGEAQSPLIQFLLAQKITGEKLVKLFREPSPAGAAGNTMDFRKLLLWEMANQTSALRTPHSAFRCPRGGDSELLAAGHLDLSGDAVWEELRDIEKEFHVGHGLPPGARASAVDCGFAEKFNRIVLQSCFERAEHYQWYDPIAKPANAGLHGFWRKGESASPARHRLCQVASADGWYALRGKPTFRPLGTGKINHELNINVEDAYYGTPEAGTKFVEVLEIPQATFWLRTDDLRKKRTKNIHTISPNVSFFPKIYQASGDRSEESRFKLADLERQCNEQYYNEEKGQVIPRSGKGGSQNKRHPYHLDDCETYQTALATHHQFFERDAQSK